MNSMTDRTPERIATEINVIKEQAREVFCRSAIEIGRRLFEAKSMIPHGSWGKWLEENVDYSERTAQNLMRVYEEYGRNAKKRIEDNFMFDCFRRNLLELLNELAGEEQYDNV